MSAAWVGVLGTLLGAALAHGFNYWSKRQDWAREDRRRFLDERRRCYAQLFHSSKMVLVNVGLRQIMGEQAPGSRDFVAETSASLDELQLLAPWPVIAAAQELMRLVTGPIPQPGSPEQKEFKEKWTTAQTRFVEAARADIEAPKTFGPPVAVDR